MTLAAPTAVATILSFIVFGGTGNCQTTDQQSGICNIDGSITNDGVVLTGDQSSGETGDGSASTDDSNTVTTCRILTGCTTTIRPFDFDITGPAVSMSDLAAFRPAPEIDHMEPNGWMIVGLSTNFYSNGPGEQVIQGTLLNQPASVRFTPVLWSWDYGDGASGGHPSAGSAWSSRGDEFTPTSTGHAYQAKGAYMITLTVSYLAYYKFAGADWVRVPGVLELRTNDLTASAGSAKTVLVDKDCHANPSGPGC